ncbi:hypothetical protein Y601_2047 [Burkholderia pseudomallei MSHR640]|nr:hypothetical protein Y601_2047 [Burkholderia pseudomallei MSHR640]
MRDHRLAPFRMRAADHGCLCDGRVRVQHVLDFLRVDILAARHDHVLDPVDDEQVTVVVDARDVAAAVPAVVVERGARGAGIVEIAEHHAVRAQPDLADFTRPREPARGGHDAHVDARRALAPDRARLHRLLERMEHGAGGPRFGHAVHLIERFASIRAHQPARERRADRPAAVQPGPHARQIERREIGDRIERQRVRHRRAEVQRDLLGLDRLQKAQRLIFAHQHDGAAHIERAAEPVVERRRVPDRHRHQRALALGHRQRERARRGGERDRAMAVHAALRAPRRARRVKDFGERRVVGRRRGDAGRVGDEAVERRGAGCFTFGREAKRVVLDVCEHGRERRIEQHRAARAVPQDVVDLRRLQLVIDRHDDRPDAPCAEQQIEERGRVQAHRGDALARRDAERREHLGRTPRALLHLPIGERRAVVAQERFVGRRARGALECGNQVHGVMFRSCSRRSLGAAARRARLRRNRRGRARASRHARGAPTRRTRAAAVRRRRRAAHRARPSRGPTRARRSASR